MTCFSVLAIGVLLSLGGASQGAESLTPMLAATGVCTISGLVALVLTGFFSRRGQFLPGVFLGMGCRLVPPLVACLWLALQERTESSNVFVFSLLIAYLVALAAETYLSLRFLSPQPSKASAH